MQAGSQPSNTQRRSDGSGFTLIEVLVAVSLLGIITLMGWRGLEGILHARSQLEQRATLLAALDRTLQQLELDIQRGLPGSRLSDLQRPGGFRSGWPAWIEVSSTANGPALRLLRTDPIDAARPVEVRWFDDGQGLQRLQRQHQIMPDNTEEPGPSLQTPPQLPMRLTTIRAWVDGQGWSELPLPEISPPVLALELRFARSVTDSPLPPTLRLVLRLPR